MKKKELFIGIDVSKSTFDVTIIPKGSLETSHHKQFKNQKAGFKQLAKWIKSLYSDYEEELHWVFCMVEGKSSCLGRSLDVRVTYTEKSADAIVVTDNEPPIEMVEVSQSNEGLNVKLPKIQ